MHAYGIRLVARLSLLMGLGLLMLSPASAATRFWIGQGGDRLWNTTANWSNSTPPAASGGDIASFFDDGINLTNLVEQSRLLAGLYYTNRVPGGLHYTDLGGNTLVISNQLRAGYQSSNSLATIANGTLVIGVSNSPGSVYCGYTTGTNGTPKFTGNRLAIQGTCVFSNLQNLVVAGSDNEWGGVEAVLDLTGAAIWSGATPHMLACSGIAIGASLTTFNSGGATGTLKLASTVTNITVDNLRIGVGDGNVVGSPCDGTLDIGSNSSLRQLTVKRGFYLATHNANGGRIGYTNETGFVDYLPTGVVMTVGQATNPAAMWIGYHNNQGVNARPLGQLTISNGVFNGYLSNLVVGANDVAAASASATGLLDLASSSVNIGGASNQFKVQSLYIGATTLASLTGGANANGILRLPPGVTNIGVGVFAVGCGGTGGSGARGTLDIGPNSALKHLAASNAFYLGANSAEYGRIGCMTGGVWNTYLPDGLFMQIGTSNSYAPMTLGHQSTLNATASGTVQLVNGRFSGYLSKVRVGVNDYNSDTYGASVGILNISNSVLDGITINDSMWIGSSDIRNNRKGKGYVHLPAGTVQIATNLWIGDTTNGLTAADGSYGLLELFGTRVSVGGRATIGTTGRITNHVLGVSAGLDLSSADANNLSFSNGAIMAIRFEMDPVDSGTDYWGLRMAGNNTNHFIALTNAGSVIVNNSGLSAEHAALLGVYHNAQLDKTFIGVPLRQTIGGTVFVFH